MQGIVEQSPAERTAGEPVALQESRVGRRRCQWIVIGLLACLLWGPSFVGSLRPERTIILDFFQEWASARNHLTGLPVYTPQSVSLEKHLGYTRPGGDQFWLEYNAHPPTSVLLVLPLAALDYPDAFFLWSMISLGLFGSTLWMVARELEIPLSLWTVAPIVTVLLVCSPFRQQINQGQLNIVLLALLSGTWICNRRGRWGAAGTLLGVATAIKLFPGFVFLYFVARRQWNVVACGAIAFLGATALTMAVLSPAAYGSYISDVMPRVVSFQDWWGNVSFWGLWLRMFDAPSGHVIALFDAPLLARALIAACSVAVVAAILIVAAKAKTTAERDLAFAASCLGMLLVSPISWNHYFLLLLAPLGILWIAIREDALRRRAFFVLFALVCLSPALVWQWAIAGPPELQGGVAGPIHAATVLAYQTLTVAALFVMTLAAAKSRSRLDISVL